MSVTIALLCASVVIMAASATRIQVSADRELNVAIVDAHASGASQESLHRALTTSLSTALARSYGAEVRIHTTTLGARDAKLRLGSGGYDAALVIGADRPNALRRLDMVTLAGTLPPSAGGQALSLVVANGDPTLKALLTDAFPRMLADDCWRNVLEEGRVSLAGRGAKLATVTR